MIVGDLAFRQIRILLAKHVPDVFKAETETVQLHWIHIHTHCGQRAAADGHLTDALNLRQPLLDDRRGGVIKLAAT